MESPQSPQPVATPQRVRVRVWFGTHVIAEYVDEPGPAARYVQGIRVRFAGLRVTTDPWRHEAPKGSPQRVPPPPVPGERLWDLAP